jgi:tRNA (guanine-N(7)-)-methyltransferase
MTEPIQYISPIKEVDDDTSSPENQDSEVCDSNSEHDERRALYENRSAPPLDTLKAKAGFHYLLSEDTLKTWVESTPSMPLYLDIGAGMGRFLMAEAEKQPDIRFIGIDPDYQCVKKNITKLHNREKRNCTLSHVRFFFGSVYHVIPHLPMESIDRAYVNYPDPWFKRRHIKRRLVTQKLFDSLHPLLKPKAQVFVQTDIDDYGEFINEELELVKNFHIQKDAISLFDGLAGTLYQEKAHSKNHNRHCFVLTKI